MGAAEQVGMGAGEAAEASVRVCRHDSSEDACDLSIQVAEAGRPH